jgi:hypothetical protein
MIRTEEGRVAALTKEGQAIAAPVALSSEQPMNIGGSEV